MTEASNWTSLWVATAILVAPSAVAVAASPPDTVTVVVLDASGTGVQSDVSVGRPGPTGYNVEQMLQTDASGRVSLQVDCSPPLSIHADPVDPWFQRTVSWQPCAKPQVSIVVSGISRQSLLALADSATRLNGALGADQAALRSAIDSGNIRNSAVLSAKLSQELRDSGQLELSKPYSSISTISGTRLLLTHDTRSVDDFVKFDQASSKWVLTEKGTGAVEQFQIDKGLSVTGQWNAATVSAVKAAHF